MIVTLSFLCFSQSIPLTLDYTLPMHLCAHACICMLHTTRQEIILAELPSRRWLELGTFHHGGCWFDQPPLVSGCCYLQLIFLLPVLSLYTLLLSSQTASWQNMPYCYLFSGSDCRRLVEVIPFSGPVRLSVMRFSVSSCSLSFCSNHGAFLLFPGHTRTAAPVGFTTVFLDGSGL